MNIDLIAVCFLLFLALWGVLKGALKEIFSAAAVAAAYFLSSPAASLALSFFKTDPTQYLIMQTAGRIAFWFILYFLMIIAGKIFEKKFLKTGKLRMANRTAGGFIGVVKAALVLTALLWTADATLTLTGFDEPVPLKKSRLYSFASKRNLMKKTNRYKRLEKMKKIKNLTQQIEILKKAGGHSGGEFMKVLESADASRIAEMLEKTKTGGKPSGIPDNLDINSLRKMLENMNSANLRKIRGAVK